MKEHRKAQYRDGAGVFVAFCKDCGKEGLQLMLEPNCPGKIEDKNLTRNEANAK